MGNFNDICLCNSNFRLSCSFAFPPIIPIPLSKLAIECMLQKNAGEGKGGGRGGEGK